MNLDLVKSIKGTGEESQNKRKGHRGSDQLNYKPQKQ